MKTRSILSVVLLVGMWTGLPLHAFAASTWDMYGHCVSGCDTSSVSAGNVATFTSSPSGDQNMVASAWSTAINNTTAGTTFAAAKLENWGSAGWGVMGGTETNATGPHAMDNYAGIDVIELSFAQAVALTSVKIGWNGTDSRTSPYIDSDLTILAYMGTSNPAPIAGLSITQLLAAGWEWVGNYADVGARTDNSVSVNAGGISSSWWLVSAYNSDYGGATNGSTKSDGYGVLSNGNDAVKLLQVAGNTVNPPPPGKVSEPTALLLMSTALFGIAGLRRRLQSEL